MISIIRKFIAVIISMALVSSMGLATIQAFEQSDGTGTSEVSIVFTDENKYNLTLNVGDGGSVIDGSQSIRKGTVRYEVGLDTTKQFKLMPDKGYKVGKVVYEKPDLKEKLDLTKEIQKNKSIELQVENTEMILTIGFEIDNTQGTGGNAQGTGGNAHEAGSIDTGDASYENLYMLLAVVVIGVAYYLYASRKKEQ